MQPAHAAAAVAALKAEGFRVWEPPSEADVAHERKPGRAQSRSRPRDRCCQTVSHRLAPSTPAAARGRTRELDTPSPFDRHGDGASAYLGDTRCWQLLAFHPVYILRSIAHAPPEFPKPKVYKHGVPLVLASSPRYTAKEFLGC